VEVPDHPTTGCWATWSSPTCPPSPWSEPVKLAEPVRGWRELPPAGSDAV